MPAVSKLLKPCSEPKSTICGQTLTICFILEYRDEEEKLRTDPIASYKISRHSSGVENKIEKH
jgi:hypothetical protein